MRHSARGRTGALSALALVTLAGCASSTGRGPAGDGPDDQVLRMTVEPTDDGQVALRVENVSGRPITISRAVRIEAVEVFGTAYSARELAGFGVPSDFFLIETCEQPTRGCAQLEPGESLRTVPWSGHYGDPQCYREAPSDYPAPPGRYRFVATACSGAPRFESASFDRGSPPPE